VGPKGLYTCEYIHIQRRTNILRHTCVNKCVRACVSARACACVCVCSCMCAYTYTEAKRRDSRTDIQNRTSGIHADRCERTGTRITSNAVPVRQKTAETRGNRTMAASTSASRMTKDDAVTPGLPSDLSRSRPAPSALGPFGSRPPPLPHASHLANSPPPTSGSDLGLALCCGLPEPTIVRPGRFGILKLSWNASQWVTTCQVFLPCD